MNTEYKAKVHLLLTLLDSLSRLDRIEKILYKSGEVSDGRNHNINDVTIYHADPPVKIGGELMEDIVVLCHEEDMNLMSSIYADSNTLVIDKSIVENE